MGRLPLRIAAMALMLATPAIGPTPARANADPPACEVGAPVLGLAVYRADGVTPIPPGGTVSVGEIIRYRATLGYAGFPRCAFEGGTWIITRPDGTDVNIGPVPNIGDPTTGTGAQVSVSSALVDYTVRGADEVFSGGVRSVSACATYSGGFVHDSPGDSAGGASFTVTLARRVVDAGSRGAGSTRLLLPAVRH
jgi:hypothetical protein